MVWFALFRFVSVTFRTTLVPILGMNITCSITLVAAACHPPRLSPVIGLHSVLSFRQEKWLLFPFCHQNVSASSFPGYCVSHGELTGQEADVVIIARRVLEYACESSRAAGQALRLRMAHHEQLKTAIRFQQESTNMTTQ
jgi:hypothetical protein